MYILNNIVMMVGSLLCAYYIFNYSQGNNFHNKRNLIILIVDMICITILSLFRNNQSVYIKVVFILIVCISLVISSEKIRFDLISVSIIALAISFCCEYIGVFISCSILFFAGMPVKNILTTSLATIIQLVLAFLLCRIPYITKGIRALYKGRNFGFGLLLSSYVLIFSLFLTSNIDYLGYELGIVALFGVPLVISGLILWIRSIVKRFYKNMLQDRMDEYTKHELEDKDKRIERLEVEVAALAKQVHRDNHLMASVDRSVQSLADCDSAEQRGQIIGEIHTLYLERNDSIAKEQQKSKILPSTGISLIDSSLSELYVKAAARGISFDLSVSEELHYLVNNIISQTDLQTLLCDHVKDAIIAVEASGAANGRILVTIEKNDSIFEISIRDSGIDFEADTLARLGKEQVTTHVDSGGSGIGFMTTFETLRKTKGSLIIAEYEQKTPFSKSVTFVFDGLNRFIISTYRKEELEAVARRDDVRIIVQ